MWCKFVALAAVVGWAISTPMPLRAESPPAPSRPPNIVFLFSDDHALQAIGTYGSRLNQTPHIDRIAREGARFDQSFCANSICGPSRACILTGKHSHANGFLRNGNHFNPHQTMFPPLLQQAGYQTALVGKWHLTSDPVGFHYWEVLPDQGSYYNPDFLQMDGSRKRYEGYCPDVVTDRALEWLQQKRDPQKPFLLMCQHKAPHRNWAPAARHFQLYQEDLPEPETLFDDYANRSKLLQENEMTLERHFHWGHDMKFHGSNLFPEHFANDHGNAEYDRMTPDQKKAWDAHYEPENQAFLQRMREKPLSSREVTRWKYQRYLKDYLRCVAALDENIGRILAYLDEQGLADNTLVVYASDQGFYLGEHGWYDKRWMFEPSLKMPLVVRWPGVIRPGAEPAAMVQNIDYAPTFLAAAGVPIPTEMQGRDLRPIFEQPEQIPAGWRDCIYYAYYENSSVHQVPVHDGIRTDRYKLFFLPRSREWQLFDLQSDPQELRSCDQDSHYADVLRGMQQRYHDVRRQFGVNSAILPQTRGDEPAWRARHQAVVKRVAEGTMRVAFLGDSITQGWETAGQGPWEKTWLPRGAVNLGFSGDRTEHVIWRLQQGEWQKATPDVAVVMIGTNNTGALQQAPAEVAAGIARVVQIVRETSPRTKVVLLGIFPRGSGNFDPLRLNNLAINDLIQRLGDEEHVFYRDVGHLFLAPDGSLPTELMPDALHLSPLGYERWSMALEQIWQDLGFKG